MPLAAAAWIKAVVTGDEHSRQVFPYWGQGDDPVVIGCCIVDCPAAVPVGLTLVSGSSGCSNPSLTLGWSWLADSNAISLLVLRGLFLTGTDSKPVEPSCEKNCFERMIFAWERSGG